MKGMMLSVGVVVGLHLLLVLSVEDMGGRFGVIVVPLGLVLDFRMVGWLSLVLNGMLGIPDVRNIR